MIANAAWCDYAVAQQHGITYQQVNLLAGAAKGMSNTVIGIELGMTEEGVKTAFKRLFRHMDVHERAAAVAKAYDIGIFRPLAERIALAEQRGAAA